MEMDTESHFTRSLCSECVFDKACKEKVYPRKCPCEDCLIKSACRMECEEAAKFFTEADRITPDFSGWSHGKIEK